MPWRDIAGHKKVADALLTPVAAGEDLYLWEGFREAIETRAFDIIHPDMLSSGGLMETKRIADHAERFGIPTALHACCSPVGFMANVHLGAVDRQPGRGRASRARPAVLQRTWCSGMDADYMADGYVTVPDAPGLGIDLNEDVIRGNLRARRQLLRRHQRVEPTCASAPTSATTRTTDGRTQAGRGNARSGRRHEDHETSDAR